MKFRSLFAALLWTPIGLFTGLVSVGAPVSTTALALEKDGLVVVEAETFRKQRLDNFRRWKVLIDGAPATDAEGGAYVQCLPDTRRNHGEKLRPGLNFSNEPGVIAVLSYPVEFTNSGRYYVWVRAFSSGTEDNGIHVGLDGEWPESGARMQWCKGKNAWRWESLQRTKEEHCGVPHSIYLDIETPGVHTIEFSMREDGFCFDRFLLTQNRDMAPPEDSGPIASTRKQSESESSLVSVRGELMTWHAVTLELQGPQAAEQDINPNPFTDYRFDVEFTHASGEPSYTVPGYFAADGDAAETSSEAGSVWRAHLSPDKAGEWSYTVQFAQGPNAAVGGKGKALAPFDGLKGTFAVAPSDKTGRDFRARGRLEYVGERYLRFAGSKDYFLKAGPDAPETLLGYADFDGTVQGKRGVPLKTWSPHRHDWKASDPVWMGNRGKGLIGALNYLASEGLNSVSFLPYNAGGDGNNVWPFVARDDKLHYDVSKLAQWGIVFDHAQKRGLYLHFKLQENELDDERIGSKKIPGHKPEALDGGLLGPERKLYLRELVARFGHHLALNWNLGEENTQTPEEVREMAAYLRGIDPYDHHIVIHTFPGQQDVVYNSLLGAQSELTGASLQNHWNRVHELTLKWITAAEATGKSWVVANDEQGPAYGGAPPDPDYEGFDGKVEEKNGETYTLHNIRKQTLWGNLMAGGAGVEYYFGYKIPQNDLLCEDYRSRDLSWDYCRFALQFFKDNAIPFERMENVDTLVSSSAGETYGYAEPGALYLAYLHEPGTANLDLGAAPGVFSIQWFNPRAGGALEADSPAEVRGGGVVTLKTPTAEPGDDWLAVVRRKQAD